MNGEQIDAVILKKNAFSESNEVVTMYSRQAGKVRGIAKAVKRLQSKLAFGLQNLFYSKIDLVDARKRLTIIGAKPVNTFKYLRENKSAVHAGLFGAELVLKSTADEQPNEALFDYFVQFLEHLDLAAKNSAPGPHLCAYFFSWQVLALTGYAVNAEACTICGRTLVSFASVGAASPANPTASQTFFSNRKSGFLCGDCAGKTADARQVSPEVFAAIQAAIAGPEDFESQDLMFASRAPQNQSSQKSELAALSNSFIEHILERDLKSARYLV